MPKFQKLDPNQVVLGRGRSSWEDESRRALLWKRVGA